MATLDSMRAPPRLSKEAALDLMKQVAAKFNFQEEIAEWLVERGVRSLQDFQQVVISNAEIETNIIEKMPGNTAWVDSKMVQTARLRIAWGSTFQAQLSEEKKQEMVESGQDLLSSRELSTLEQRWFMRYKFKPEAGACPSDWVVTAAARQLRSRRIVQPNLLALKTLEAQKGAKERRDRLGELGNRSLELVDRTGDEQSEATENVENYFLGMELWVLAFAMAGNEALDTAPAAPEGPESDSTDYIAVPWDVPEKWLTRARTMVRKVPRNLRLAWLRNRVEADIRIWIDNYRLQTSKTLGKVIKACFEQTASSWYYDEEDIPPSGSGRARGRPRSKDSRSSHGKKDKKRKGSGAKPKGNEKKQEEKKRPISDTMRNGERICREWNLGRCRDKEADCPKRYKHVCNIMTKKNGRVCGMYNHRACEHGKKDSKGSASNRR